MSTNILLLCGGDGSEHDVSLVSSRFVEQKLKETPDFNVLYGVIHNHQFQVDDVPGYFNHEGEFCYGVSKFKVDCVVPCIHGTPGETGELQSFLEILNIPYIGCGVQASYNCFNKIITKQYLTAFGIPNSPSTAVYADTPEFKAHALRFFDDNGSDVYVKAASEGSSVGCYHVTERAKLWPTVQEAFKYCSDVLLEKNIIHRELEVAAYELDGKIITTAPGEIVMPEDEFYTFEEKYSEKSRTVTTVEPKNLTEEQLKTIDDYAQRAFKSLKLRDLSRIDFFLSEEDGILINEINTFPGMTPISMFPKLLEHHGDNIADFFAQCVRRAIAEKK